MKDDLSLDDHILQTSKTMNYYVHVLRRLYNIFPRKFLLKMYISYVQLKLDYGVSTRECTNEGNVDRIQINFCARIICRKYHYVNLVKTLLNIEDTDNSSSRDYCLSVLMLKDIHGLAPHYLCNDWWWFVMSMVMILEARKIWIDTYRRIRKTNSHCTM